MGARLLTIGVCTYNRNAMLVALVDSLLPQLTPCCEILVLDNGSEVPVADSLGAAFGADQLKQIRVIRLRVNIGPAILRCLEECQTDWMWGLNDKAVIRPDGVQTVLRSIEENPDCVLINFTPHQQQAGAGGPKRDAAVKTTGQLQLIENILDYGSTLDYMANVFCVPSYSKSFGAAYLHGGPGSGQFAIVLHAVGDNKHCLFSNQVPVERPPTDPSLRWSQLDYLATYMLSLGIVQTEAARAKLTSDILAFMPSRKYFVVKLLYLATTDPGKARYYFDVYRFMMLNYDRRLSTRGLLLVGSGLIRFPSGSVALLAAISQSLFDRDLRDAL